MSAPKRVAQLLDEGRLIAAFPIELGTAPPEVVKYGTKYFVVAESQSRPAHVLAYRLARALEIEGRDSGVPAR